MGVARGGADAVGEVVALEHRAPGKNRDGRDGGVPGQHARVGERQQACAAPGDRLANGTPETGAVDIQVAGPRQGLDADVMGAPACIGDIQIGDVDGIGLSGAELQADVHVIKVDIAHLAVHGAMG